MTDKMKKNKKEIEFEQKIGELTADLQRTRADFENYRKRVESEKLLSRESGQASAILKLIPVIDNIERALAHRPVDLEGNAWADGVASLIKNLEKSLETLDLTRINAAPGTAFNPRLHEAVQFDELGDGDHEVVSEELQSGYLFGGDVLRPAIVKVVRQ
jgi:molecular chaperone GrpE